jgi:CysZ protein
VYKDSLASQGEAIVTGNPHPSSAPSGAQGGGSLPGELIAGATYPFQALAILNRTRKLWGYVIVPILVNIVVGILLYAGLFIAGMNAIDNLIAGLPPEWGAFLAVLLRVLLLVVLLISTGFVLLRFGVVLGAPWYSQLAEQLERVRIQQQTVDDKTHPLTIARDIWEALMFELKKLLLFAVCAVLLLLLNFLPIVGTLLSSVGWLSLGAVIVCLDFFDPSLSRRRLKFRTKMGLIRRSLPASASFGLVCLGLVSIPLLNLLAIPLCVAAGTLFFCDRLRFLLPDTAQP